MSKHILFTLAITGVTFVAGCADSDSAVTAKKGEAATVASEFLLEMEPADAMDVGAARKQIKDGEDVVVVGRIGGNTSPFLDESAAFTIVDRSLVPCNEIEGDTCTTPWDYCCQTDQLPTNTAFVKVVEPSGGTVPTPARQLLGVEELDTVVVEGKAKRDDAGNLTILADGVFVKR